MVLVSFFILYWGKSLFAGTFTDAAAARSQKGRRWEKGTHHVSECASCSTFLKLRAEVICRGHCVESQASRLGPAPSV